MSTRTLVLAVPRLATRAPYLARFAGRCLAVVLLFLVAPSFAQSDRPSTTRASAIRLDDLTVPADQLSAGCAISPANAVGGGGHRVRSGLWAGLPSNPWRGTDANVIAMMQEVIVAMPRMPSQVTHQDAAQFRLRLVDAVEEGYGAAYSDGAEDLIVVYAVRYAEGVTPLPGRAGTLASAQVVALVSGKDRPCARFIAAHVRSVMGL